MEKKSDPSLSSQVDFYNEYWKDLKPFGDYKLQRIIEILKILKSVRKQYKNPKILDFGCGDGRSVPIWGLVGEAHGFDLSESAMKIATANFPTFSFKYGDACNSDYNSDFYDILISQEVIEHIVDQDKYVEECYKLLKDGGSLILTTPNKFYFDRVKGGNYSRQPIENIIDAAQLKTLISKKFKIKSTYSLINAKGDFGIYKWICNRYLLFIIKKVGLNSWFQQFLGNRFYKLHLVIIAQKK